MKLLIFHFFITHRLEKTNLVDTLSRRLDYKSENESLNRLSRSLTLLLRLLIINSSSHA